MLSTGATLSLGEWLRGLWNYYWQYTRTRTGTHGAATAALTAFGLLAYFHRAFVIVAIISYIFPPVYLYMTDEDARSERLGTRERDTDPDDSDTDTDTDSDDSDTDTDSDGVDADADADADGADADADADG